MKNQSSSINSGSNFAEGKTRTERPIQPCDAKAHSPQINHKLQTIHAAAAFYLMLLFTPLLFNSNLLSRESSGTLTKMAAAQHEVDVGTAMLDAMRPFDSIPSTKWDGVAESLRENNGVATIDFLPADISSMHAACFETARRGLDVAKGVRVGSKDTRITLPVKRPSV